MRRLWTFVSTPRFSYLDNAAIFVIMGIVLAWWLR